MDKLNIMLIISYDGTGYSGWQRIGNAQKPSIQALLENRISGLLGQRIRLIGSGRTDAGVHAIAQTANFICRTSDGEIPKNFTAHLNYILPEDIRIVSARKVPLTFHSRHDAISKTYEYRIDLRRPPSVFDRRWTYQEKGELSVELMGQAAEYLVGMHDFAAFSTNGETKRATIRTIYRFEIIREGNNLRMEVTGDGFLYHMVRIMVGTLIEVGRGERSPREIPLILRSRERNTAGWMAPPQGLFLKEVHYEHI